MTHAAALKTILRPPPLAYRRPALLWVPLGLVLAPIIAFGALFVLRPSPWSLAMMIFGLVGSLIIGGAWAVLTRNCTRRRRVLVVLEVVVLGFLYPLILAAGLLVVRAAIIGAEQGWDIAARSLDDGQVIGWSLLLAGASILVTPFVGVAFSWIAMERPAAPSAE